MPGNARTILKLSVKAGRSGRFIAILQSDVPIAMTGVLMWILQKKAPRTWVFVNGDVLISESGRIRRKYVYS